MKNSRTNFPNLLIISVLIALFSFSNSSNLLASSDSGDEQKEEGATDFIMHHIADDYQWHIVTLGHTHVTIPLPMIIYDHGELKFFMSSDFYDEHHEPIAHEGYMISHGKLVRAEGGHGAADSHGESDGHGSDDDHGAAADDHSEAKSDFLNLSITKNVASLLLSAVLMIVVFTSVAKRYKNGVAAPKGLQSFFEPIIVFIRDDIAKVNIGADKYQRFMPYLLTLFFFILFNNLLGLTPGAANLTGNIAVTLCLALFTFFITQFNGRKAYWMHILWTPGVPLPLRPIILVVEVIGIFTKPISLTLRLFASITAGHIVVLSIIGLGFILNSLALGVVGTLFSAIITVIEILVAMIQAYVFTLFSSMYIGQAVDDGHH
ncbi:ATP synthase F0 subunit A [Roseivirga misakiensis]|uniref:ATP synthase subunit a n=2 Tax=Roseivirga misakiensis TaxID=1563681 RepID=A0A1E5T7A8_9BACT|nr:ATP synthase F0 subunit A [Roseivirga misakiensis]